MQNLLTIATCIAMPALAVYAMWVAVDLDTITTALNSGSAWVAK